MVPHKARASSDRSASLARRRRRRVGSVGGHWISLTRRQPAGHRETTSQELPRRPRRCHCPPIRALATVAMSEAKTRCRRSAAADSVAQDSVPRDSVPPAVTTVVAIAAPPAPTPPPIAPTAKPTPAVQSVPSNASSKPARESAGRVATSTTSKAARPTRWVSSISRDWVTVRAGASKRSRLIASIGPNSRVQLGESRDGWQAHSSEGSRRVGRATRRIPRCDESMILLLSRVAVIPSKARDLAHCVRNCDKGDGRSRWADDADVTWLPIPNSQSELVPPALKLDSAKARIARLMDRR